MGNNIPSSSINKDILVKELGLKQYSNTTVFIKGRIFVLSPSIQNNHGWFDLRKVNIDRFNADFEISILILRYLDKFLVSNLKEFKENMMPEDKTVFTKAIGIHWKFNVVKQGLQFYVVNQQKRDYKFPVSEVTIEQLKEMIC